MRVLHLASEYPPQQVFGLGRFVYDLAGAQAAQGDEVCVVTNSLSGDRHEIAERGVRVCRVHWPPPPKPADESATVMQFNVQVLERAMPVLEAWEPEVINVHDWLTAAAGKVLKKVYGVPLVMTVHDTVMGKSFGKLDNEKRFIGRIEEWIARRADRLIANSNWVKGEMVETYGALPEKVDVAPCAVDASAFDGEATPEHRAAFRSVLAEPDERIVLYTGRLDTEKGLEVVMNALPLVLAKCPKAKFVLGGKGRMRGALEEHLKKNSLTDRVLFAGYVLPPALAYLYHAGDVHVVPSTYEPFGIVALEAMACGKAVVASKTGGLAEIVEHRKTGLLFRPGSHEELAEALVQLVMDPDRCERFGRAGRQRAVEVYNWQRVAKLTGEVYARAIEHPMAGMARPAGKPAVAPEARPKPAEKTGSRILFDCQQLGPEMSGVGHYTERVLGAMLELGRGLEWLLLCHRGNADYVGNLAAGRSDVRLVTLCRPVPLDYRRQQEVLAEIVPAEGVDLYFSPCFMSVPPGLCPTVSVVHDASYEARPDLFPEGFAEYMRACVAETCRNAARVITMSGSSRSDISGAYGLPPERIEVIPLAADRRFFGPVDPEDVDRVRGKYGLHEGYVLVVNVGSRKKNFPFLARAYAGVAPEARRGTKLVAVGAWDPGEIDLAAAVKEAGIEGDAVLAGHVPLADLAALYAGAQVFCFPSLHEGFGLPVLEAMAAGTPVIASNAASLPEVAGDAAVLLAPASAKAWSAAIERLLTSAEEREALVNRGWKRAAEFGWEKTAAATLSVIRDVLVASGRLIPTGEKKDAPTFEPVPFEGRACAITVDDVRPEPGFGGEREKGPLGLLLKLHEEFGAKFTLFVPTNWRGKWPLEEHAEWLKWLLAQGCFEVASHGHLHDAGGAPWEFKGRSERELDGVLDQSFRAFAAAGHVPQGVKAPGWMIEPSAYGVFGRRFRYVADHVQGTNPACLAGGKLLRMPYTYTIDRLGPWSEKGLVVLHSHVAPEGATTNGWTPQFYERLREYLAAGKRQGVEFLTLGEVAERIRPVGKDALRNASQAAAQDERLRGGEVKVLGEEAGVLYGAAGEPCPHLLRAEDATIAILSRNRREYLADLLRSIDETAPAELGRVVLLNNCEDDSAVHLAERFPNWRVVQLNDADHPEEPAGLAWLKANVPDLLPGGGKNLGPAAGWTAPRSIGWLRNRQWAECGREFLVSFDDDYIVKPGWWEYYVRFQNEFRAHAVINNFGAFVMCRSVLEKVGSFDERFLGSHGYEDNDYSARLAEAGLRWVLGFNREHDWRSAEEGNPRGSGTGADYFIHRYALKSGGYAARRDEAKQDPARAAWNGRWYAAKWEETPEPTGVFPRPPFRGRYLRRKIGEEPDWLAPPRKPAAPAAGPGVKTSENTPLEEVDPVSNPASGTMVDRYSFAAHWCRDRRVLDAACGHGYGSALLHALGAREVVGVDSDREALRQAELRYAGPRISFRHLDLTDGQDDPAGTFETVVSIETMEHLRREDVGKYLASLRSHLTPGGTAFITTPRRERAEWSYRGGTHRYEYSPEEFRALVEKAFVGARISYLGIQEFRTHGEARLYSRLAPSIDESTRIMIAVAEDVPPRDGGRSS